MGSSWSGKAGPPFPPWNRQLSLRATQKKLLRLSWQLEGLPRGGVGSSREERSSFVRSFVHSFIYSSMVVLCRVIIPGPYCAHTRIGPGLAPSLLVNSQSPAPCPRTFAVLTLPLGQRPHPLGQAVSRYYETGLWYFYISNLLLLGTLCLESPLRSGELTSGQPSQPRANTPSPVGHSPLPQTPFVTTCSQLPFSPLQA